MDDMSKISFAAGGSEQTYSWITYVAKDKRGNRCMVVETMLTHAVSHQHNIDCHVFDCGAVADDILATLGQVFTISQASL
jgi:hypothetical protein